MAAGGSILIITSYAGFTPSNVLGAYSVSKTSLIGLTKVLAKDLAPRGIRGNSVQKQRNLIHPYELD